MKMAICHLNLEAGGCLFFFLFWRTHCGVTCQPGRIFCTYTLDYQIYWTVYTRVDTLESGLLHTDHSGYVPCCFSSVSWFCVNTILLFYICHLIVFYLLTQHLKFWNNSFLNCVASADRTECYTLIGLGMKKIFFFYAPAINHLPVIVSPSTKVAMSIFLCKHSKHNKRKQTEPQQWRRILLGRRATNGADT